MILFSVVIPVFNAAESIGRTLAALERQQLPAGVKLEIVVADDGSSDESTELVQQFYPSVTVVRQENSGPAAARNLGAAASTGDYLLFVDSDDIPSEDWIATFAELVTTPNVGVAGCGARFMDGNNRETVEVIPSSKPNQVVLRVSGVTAVRRDLFEQIDGYDVALKFGENSDMISRALEQCRSSGAQVVTRDVISIDLVFGNTSASYDQKRLDAMLHLLERDRATIERNPKLRARYYSIAAVNAGRCEEWPSARRYALSAVRAEPADVRHITRLALSLFPLVARRRWTSNRTRLGQLGDGC